MKERKNGWDTIIKNLWHSRFKMKREDIVKFVIDCLGQGIVFRKLVSRENELVWHVNDGFDIFVTYQYVENFGDSEYTHKWNLLPSLDKSKLQ